MNGKDLSVATLFHYMNEYKHGLEVKESNRSRPFERTKELFKEWVYEQRLPTGKVGQFRMNSVIKKLKSKTEYEQNTLYSVFKDYIVMLQSEGIM